MTDLAMISAPELKGREALEVDGILQSGQEEIFAAHVAEEKPEDTALAPPPPGPLAFTLPKKDPQAAAQPQQLLENTLAESHANPPQQPGNEEPSVDICLPPIERSIPPHSTQPAPAITALETPRKVLRGRPKGGNGNAQKSNPPTAKGADIFSTTPPPSRKGGLRHRQKPRSPIEGMVDSTILDAMLDDVEDRLPAPPSSSRKRGNGTRRPELAAHKRQKEAAAPASDFAPPAALTAAEETDEDVMFGCSKCRYGRGGCGTCRLRPPLFTRPRSRWDPAQARPQDVDMAPTFRPTAEEFQDPIAYISKIMPEAAKYGLAHIVPPPGWDPPFALDKGTNGVSMESFKFPVRKQLTSHLCYRSALCVPVVNSGQEGQQTRCGEPMLAGAGMGAEVELQEQQVSSAWAPPPSMRMQKKPQQAQQGQQQSAPAPALRAADSAQKAPEPPQASPPPQPVALVGPTPAAPPPQPVVESEPTDVNAPQLQTAASDLSLSSENTAPMDFGFTILDNSHTLRSFSAYSDWAKSVHFSAPPAAGAGTPSACKLRPAKTLPVQYAAPVEPSVEEIEAEFWRVVESPESQLETMYGQDLDSGHHGSGFPLPEWRRRLLEDHLTAEKGGGERVVLPPPSTRAEIAFAGHPWNINNMPRCKDSVLRYLLGDGLITGVMVPWLYVGSCMSAFCWHVEDHALYSINYMHMGAPKVWYGVPSSATTAFEEAMRDALPHLFAATPGLLYNLVTTLSPTELRKRGIPVHQVVHEAGSFVVTMPNAYHAGFNTGFNVAEAVNFAAPNWLPFGTDVAEKYRNSRKPVTMSHDSLLVALATAAQHVPDGRQQRAAAAGAADFQPAAENGKNNASTAGMDEEKTAEASGFGPLGDIPWADAPLEGIKLGTGELSLRAAEERQRWAAGLAALGVSALPRRPIDPHAGPGATDAAGVHTNTAECDCAECSGDLWLAAVVSSAAPGIAVCPEHAAVLVQKHGCPVESLAVLCRHSPEELQALVDAAVGRVKGAAEAVAAAHARRARYEAERVRVVPVGPLYPTNERGECIPAAPAVHQEAVSCGVASAAAVPAAVPSVAPQLVANFNMLEQQQQRPVLPAPAAAAEAPLPAAPTNEEKEQLEQIQPVEVDATAGAGLVRGDDAVDKEMRALLSAGNAIIGAASVLEGWAWPLVPY